MRSQSGVTLIEILVVVGIMGVIGLAVGFQLKSLDETRYRIEAMSTRDALNLRIRRTISKANLTYSAQNIVDGGNTDLLACVDDDSATVCSQTNVLQQQSFVLAYPVDGQPRLVSGSAMSPASYNHNGKLCTDPTNCHPEWESRTYFTAICPGSQATCPKAAYIQARFHLRNVSLRKLRTLPSVPPDDDFNDPNKPTLGMISIKLDTEEASSPCNANSVVTKVSSNGNVSCSCLPGANQTGTSGNQPVCELQDLRCPNNKKPIGYTKEMQPICVDERLNCKEIRTGQTCAGFINGVRVGGCVTSLAPSKKKKGDTDNSATCDEDFYVCCLPG